ncbi:MAG TPA: methyltransferase domain-containing protein [Herpetosiphonaceae bacterium]|nr:methyltransferase domain-containing protein [Herpetosiphonaceae bacterium]
MTSTPDPADQKRRVRENFNTIAVGYDTLRFVQVCAGRLMELAVLPVGARVLDVATGTGLVAMTAAAIVGPNGAVVGIDLSPEMLERARQKLKQAGSTHVDFQEGDAERLTFPDDSFDVVLCASSLFFVPDMLAALREWRRVLVPGGFAGFTAFGATFHHPLRELWSRRLQQHGLTPPVPPNGRLADPATCEQLLREAGFARIEVRTEQLGYHLTAEERWQELQASLEARPLVQLSAAQREQIKAEHLAELEALAPPRGIWVDVPAHFAFGSKPAA